MSSCFLIKAFLLSLLSHLSNVYSSRLSDLLSNYPTQPFKSLHTRPILKPLLHAPPFNSPLTWPQPDLLMTAPWVCHWNGTVISSNISVPGIWIQTPGSVNYFRIPLFDWPQTQIFIQLSPSLFLRTDPKPGPLLTVNACLVWIQAFANYSNINTALSI